MKDCLYHIFINSITCRVFHAQCELREAIQFLKFFRVVNLMARPNITGHKVLEILGAINRFGRTKPTSASARIDIENVELSHRQCCSRAS